MSKSSSTHSSFTIERSFAASPAAVFKAWATPDIKAKWFVGPKDQWKMVERHFDFRVGGRERVKGAFHGGKASEYDAYYWDVVPDKRIVYTYDMHIDRKRISVSLSTVELFGSGDKTLMRYTEQVVFLDGYDDAGSRNVGTAGLFDNLAQIFVKTPAA